MMIIRGRSKQKLTMSALSLSFPSFCNSGLGPGGNLGSLLSGSSSIVDACNGSEGRRGWLGGSFEEGSIVSFSLSSAKNQIRGSNSKNYR